MEASCASFAICDTFTA